MRAVPALRAWQIFFQTLDAICAWLDCQPSDLLVHMPEPAADQ
nr:helix-turn-helix domain-containing protein [uncultured Pseudomonas sp.]